MFSLTNHIADLLSAQDKKRTLVLLGLMIAMSFIEVLGIASIVPFMTVLSGPESIESNEWLRKGYDVLGFESINRYMFFLGIVVLIFLLLGNALKALTKWSQLYFSYMLGYKLAKRLFSHYLNQPYGFFLQNNSGHLAKNILTEIHSLTTNIIIPIIDVIARSLVSLFILMLLVLVDPVLALTAMFVLGGSFTVIYMFFQAKLFKLGEGRYQAQAERFKIVNEAIQGIKNVKITGHEETYYNLFERPAKKFALSQVKEGTIREMPRFAIEVLAFGGALLIVLYLLISDKGISQIMPLLALYAFSGYRLMPNLQGIYTSMTKIRFNYPVLKGIHEEMHKGRIINQITSNRDIKPLPFKSKISFRDVGFRYEGAKEQNIKNANLDIPVNTICGVVGKTGAGKTTFVDLLLGLLVPDEGQIQVDGVTVDSQNMTAWQKNLAYVSQHIYLSDDSVRRNIAFGFSDEEIDEHLVKEAAKAADLDEFIEKELPQIYDTIIGENGIRLSGGQRQRLGLARALYLDRPVLILDEATSALDMKTEKKIMDMIEKSAKNKTIVMIAHRLETLKHCGSILEINNGKIESKQ